MMYHTLTEKDAQDLSLLLLKALDIACGALRHLKEACVGRRALGSVTGW